MLFASIHPPSKYFKSKEHHLKSFSTDLNKSHPSPKPKNLWWCKKRPIYSYTSSCHDISLSPEGFPNIPHAPSSPHKYSISRVHKYSTNPTEIQIQYSSQSPPLLSLWLPSSPAITQEDPLLFTQKLPTDSLFLYPPLPHFSGADFIWCVKQKYDKCKFLNINRNYE